jgi:N-acetyl-anhydromuramyl-L-alanine amidase AmpD
LQLAPFEDRTWHAGKGAVWRGIEGVNVRSIGIDVDNLGFLTRKGSLFLDAYGTTYNGLAPFLAADGSYWEPYREESIRELCAHLRRLADLFPIVRTDPDRLLPHSAVKQGKSDTGPAFPWDEIRSAVGVTYADP